MKSLHSRFAIICHFSIHQELENDRNYERDTALTNVFEAINLREPRLRC
jgi:hypothetical protein